MIVVDTNVIAYLWIPGAFTAEAERLLEKDGDWCAPVLWRSEFRNVVATHVRARRVDIETAVEIATRAEEMMKGREFEVASAPVLRRARESRRSAYDCEFVVLAEEMGIPLATTDRQLLRSFPSVARSLASVLAER